MSLNDDYKYCEKIIKKNSLTFYKAFSLLEENKAKAVYAIYAFCRHSDDAIDVYNSIEKLEVLEKELKLFEKGEIIDKPFWRALKDVFEKFNMDIKPFYEMIEGQKMDNKFSNIKTQDELLDYSYYVAGTVGLMILPVIASKNHKTLKDSAIKLGKAMQITNILRDVGEDLKNNRVYIPKEIMEKFNYSYEELNMQILNDNFKNLWEYEAQFAQKLYDEFYNEIDLFDSDTKTAVLTSAKLYNAILDAVRKNNYNCFNKKNYVNFKEKIKIITKIKSEIV